MEFAFGKPGLVTISLFQFAFAFGGMAAYCVIIGDTIPHVVRSLFPHIDQVPFFWILADRKLCISFFTLTISYPLSLYRDISKLAKTSALALVAIVIIIVTVAIEGPQTSPSIRGSSELRFSIVNDEVVQAVAVISFGIALVTCLALAVTGYWSFTDKTVGNILNNFPSDNTLINIARLSFGLNMFTTIPLEAFVCREVLETYYWPSSPFNKIRHFLITTLLILTSIAISLLTCNLGIVLELTGGFSATVLAFVLPPLCFLKLSKGPVLQRSKIPHLTCTAFGIIIMVISTFYSIQKALAPTDTSNQAETCN
ncbi:hypothetical protein G6F56_010664 [Rhizopus delemar]|nr:hypothetical protein G6F56_010664 [Rhizopus delemar]